MPTVDIPDFITEDRTDPFTGFVNAIEITNELKTAGPIAELSWLSGIRLWEEPQPPAGTETVNDKFQLFKETAPGSGVYTVPMFQIDVTDEPSAGQFKVSWGTGRGFLKLSAAEAGLNFRAVYFGMGSIVRAAYFRLLPPGAIAWALPSLPGAWSLTLWSQLGWAVAKGGTAADQGILGAEITGTLPDMLTDGRFIRSALTEAGDGVLQASQNLSHNHGGGAHGHGVSDPGHGHPGGENKPTGSGSLAGWVSDLADGTPGPFNIENDISPNATGITVNGSGVIIATEGGSEARPNNISAIPLIKVK